MTSSRQLPELDRYLARRGFRPHPSHSAWLDRDTGPQIIRVLHEPGEATLLYCLDPYSVCLYEAVFGPGTPDAVIIAAIEAALSPPPPKPGRGRTRQATGRRNLAIRLYNLRGVTARDPQDGGKQERELAERYRARAGGFSDNWPQTAAVLRQLAERYDTDAREEENRAERFRQGQQR